MRGNVAGGLGRVNAKSGVMARWTALSKRFSTAKAPSPPRQEEGAAETFDPGAFRLNFAPLRLPLFLPRGEISSRKDF
jgi:hypothetical protein